MFDNWINSALQHVRAHSRRTRSGRTNVSSHTRNAPAAHPTTSARRSPQPPRLDNADRNHLVRQLHEANASAGRLAAELKRAQQSANIYANQLAVEQRANEALTNQICDLQTQIEQWKMAASQARQQAKKSEAKVSQQSATLAQSEKAVTALGAENDILKREVARLQQALDHAWSVARKAPKDEDAEYHQPLPPPEPEEIAISYEKKMAFVLWEGPGDYVARTGTRGPLKFHRLIGTQPPQTTLLNLTQRPV